MLPKPTPRTRGYTLIEIVVSMSIMTLLMGGVMSSMLIATHALPENSAKSAPAMTSAAAVSDMVGELCYATDFTELLPQSVTFTVADRTGDLFPETIRYAWSGSNGTPLTRQLNGGTPIPVLDNMNTLTIRYARSSKTFTNDAGPSESASSVLFDSSTVTESGAVTINSTLSLSQYFKPTLPADTVSWSITSVRLLVMGSNPFNGITAVEIQEANVDERPNGTVIDRAQMRESTLEWTFTWMPLAFSARNLLPTDGVCVVLYDDNGRGNVADISLDMQGGSGLFTAPGGTATWTAWKSVEIPMFISGTFTTSGGPVNVTRYWLVGVNVSARAGDKGDAHIESAADILNVPEVSAP